MAKRKTKEQYIKAIDKKAKFTGVFIKGDLNKREKIILSTRLSIYHPVCKKTRICKVSSFLNYPDCQYCSKVNRNKALINRRNKAYKKFPKPDKGKTPAKKISKALSLKVGPLKDGILLTNDKSTLGERTVAQVLYSLKVPYEVEHPIWLNHHSKTPLRADFCVDLEGTKYIIEYDGEQHFRPIKKYGGSRRYYRTLMLDEAKDTFINRHKDYKLLRIPYWEFNNIEYHIRKFLPIK